MRQLLRIGACIFALTTFTFAAPIVAAADSQICGPLGCWDPSQAAERARDRLAGSALQQWFTTARATLIDNAVPIPPRIRRKLAGFSDADAMRRARYVIEDDDTLDLTSLIKRWGLQDFSAVTLVDVIVFKSQAEAEDPCLWAHELVHVGQFRDWGVGAFALSYARDPNTAEDPAYAKERVCRKRLGIR